MAEKSIGGLWNHSKDGKDYMTGNIEIVEGQKIKIIAFINDRKKNDKEPDWRLYISKPKEEEKKEPF